MKNENFLDYPTISVLSTADEDKWYEVSYGIETNKIIPICLVCGKRMRRSYKCSRCGYDQTTEYEIHKTIGMILPETVSVVKRRELYQENLIQSRVSALTRENEELKQQATETALKVGDIYTFGTYPQTKDGARKPIEWKVLEVKDGKALLQSVCGLDTKPYNDELVDITWEKCSLRKWLNTDFINKAFTSQEQSKISEGLVKAEKNPEFDTDPGNDTKDKVFLLSIQEAESYYKSDKERMCKATAYAKANGAWVKDDDGQGCGNSVWWLRSPGRSSGIAAIVYSDGSVNYGGYVVCSDSNVVRPALWINL